MSEKQIRSEHPMLAFAEIVSRKSQESFIVSEDLQKERERAHERYGDHLGEVFFRWVYVNPPVDEPDLYRNAFVYLLTKTMHDSSRVKVYSAFMEAIDLKLQKVQQ